MREIYNATVNAVHKYTHPKSNVVLNARATIEVTPTEETIEVVRTEVPAVEEEPAVMVIDASEVLEEVNPKEMKKSELIEYVQTVHGEDADVSGTKADIVARYFS